MQACSHHFWRIVLPVFLSLLAPAPAVLAEFVLSERCPPGFELSKDHCELRSLYQMYASLEDAGVGGLKTGLPRYRDGYTPQQIDLGRSTGASGHPMPRSAPTLWNVAWPQDFQEAGSSIRLDQVYAAITAFELSLI